MNNGEPTNNSVFDWLRKNIIAILIISSGIIAGYVRLDSQVNSLEADLNEKKTARDKEVAEITAQLDLIKQQYVTRTELNAVVVDRLDRIETKIDRVIEEK